MTTKKPFLSTQAVRRVYEDEEEFSFLSPSCPSPIVYIASRFDVAFGSDIVLWDDICAAFDGALRVRLGEIILAFVKGDDFENLLPLRIEAFSGDVLEVVVKRPPPLPQIVSPLPPATAVAANKTPNGSSDTLNVTVAIATLAGIGYFISRHATYENIKRFKDMLPGT